MSRFRLYPAAAQQSSLLEQCRQARYVWNLTLEQWAARGPGRSAPPGFAELCRHLTDARAAVDWLRAGSQTVQQQALRDFDQAVKNFRAGTHRRRTWRKAAVDVGFRIVGSQASRVRKLNRRWAEVNVPKIGLSKTELARLTDLQHRPARCHRRSNRRERLKVAIAKLYARARNGRKDWVEKTSTDLARRFDVIRVEDLRIGQMTRRPKPKPDPDGQVRYLPNSRRAKAGLNRGILSNGWGALVR